MVGQIGASRPICGLATGFFRYGSFLMSCGALLRPVIILFTLGKKRLEAVVNLGQFPKNRNKQNCDYEQQELGSHLVAFRDKNWKRSGILLPQPEGVVRTNVSEHGRDSESQ
jgi:hypothetical protein